MTIVLVVIAFIGTVLNICRNRFCFILWIIANVGFAHAQFMNFIKHGEIDYLYTTGMFALNVVASIIGYYKWENKSLTYDNRLFKEPE